MTTILYSHENFKKWLEKIRPKLMKLGIYLNVDKRLAFCSSILCNIVTFKWNVYDATFENLLFKVALNGKIEISLGTGQLNQIGNNLCFLMTMDFTVDMPQQANICSIFYRTAWNAPSRNFIKTYDKNRKKLEGESRKAEAAINFLKTIAKLFGCSDVKLQDYSKILSKNRYFFYPMAELKYLQPSEFSSYYYRYGFDRKDIPTEKKTIKIVSPKEISEQKLEDKNYEDFLQMMDLRISDAPTLSKVNEHILKTSKKDEKELDLLEYFESNQYDQKLNQFKDMVFSKFKYLKLDDNNNAIAVNFDLNDYLYCDLSKLAFSTSDQILHFINDCKSTDEDVGTFGSFSPSKRKKTLDEFSSSEESEEGDESEEGNEPDEHDQNLEQKEIISPNKRLKFTRESSSQVSSPFSSPFSYPSSSQNLFLSSRHNTHDIPRPHFNAMNSPHDFPFRNTSNPASQFNLEDDEWVDEGVRIEIDSGSDDDE